MNKIMNNKKEETNPESYVLLGNIAIAKFMGIKPIKVISEHGEKEYYYYNNTKTQDYEELPSYDCEWNDLMAVVEEINKRDWVTIFADECKIHAFQNEEFENIKIIKEGTHLIDVVYDAVLKYVEWYLANVKNMDSVL